MCPHGHYQLAAARGELDTLGENLVDDAHRQVLQQRHAFAQGRLERDLAAHRPFGDGGDTRLQPGKFGEFVDAFLSDHRRVHVGQKKLLAPDGFRLHDDVDRHVAAQVAQARLDLVDLALAGERDVDRDFVEQPARRPRRWQYGQEGLHDGGIKRGIGGIADEGGDERHPVTLPGINKAVLIAGPTASGKSALALELAQKAGGAVINTDSMQVYRDLRVLTARPSLAEEAAVPHRLYGCVDAAVNYSAGHYVRDAKEVLDEVRRGGGLPIFIGGTGLYFKALTRGLSAVPPVPDEVREAVRLRLDRDGVEALHAELARRDAAAAARLNVRDRTRIARALEVIEATGRPLAEWHAETTPPLLPEGSYRALFIAPEREALYARIDARFDAMLADGALEEVTRLAARGLDPLLPAMKAHGVPALIRHLRGEITREEAAVIGKADTRHYAKRQFTWFRHQLPEFEWLTPEQARGWVAFL